MMKSFILLALVPQVSPSPVPIQCRAAFGKNQNPMLQKLITISPSQINDGYCDCPLDGIDEPNTSACSGSIDGGWAGVLPKYKPTDEKAAQISNYFVCHQQPNLKLPLSRVNDGICDCCDGSDEVLSTTTTSTSSPTATTCPDICDIVLAAEREAKQKVINDYNIGSQKRLDSISQYKQWYTDSETKVEQMKNVELNTMEREYHDTIKKIKDSKYALAVNWMTTIDTTVNQQIFIKELFSIDEYDSSNLSSFIIGLCKLSGELSNDNVANDRCVAFDRASLDLGYLWEYGSSSDSDELPDYTTVGDDIPNLIAYAEKIILRLDGKDTFKDRVKTNNKKVDKRSADHRPEDSSGDDPYGDDWHDEHDYHYDDDYVENDDEFDKYNEESVEDEGDATEDKDEEEDTEGCDKMCPMDVYECPNGSFKSRDPCNDCNFEQCEGEDDKQLSANERLLKSLLDDVPLDRSLFKKQSDMLLKKISVFEEEAKEAAEEAAKNTDADDEGNDESSSEVDNETTEEADNGIDPMAYRMVKTNIKKHLANISRGETAARSTARFIASMIDREGDQALQVALRQLAIMTIYHSCVSVEDLAELIFSTAKTLRSAADDSPCPTSWDTMCSPSTKQSEYPPLFIVEAAQRRCEQRSISGVCPVVAQVDDEVDIPASISDGYYNYYAPQTCNPDDGVTKHFTSIDSLHQKPTEIKALNKQKDDIDRKKKSLTKKIEDLERDLVGGDGGNSKYGVGGELYSMRDTCFKVESGKYEYETCIFGKATQRDIGQSSGGTNLGNYEKIDFENGVRTLKWGGGTKCWNGPVRSAEVEVTCGAETKLLTANEPDTCRYVLTMESPIACDDTFKKTRVNTK